MTPRDVDIFWDAATALLDRPGVTRSTMMGFPCLRLHGDFFASWDPHQHALVVKLDEPTVNDMLVQSVGDVFAPSGRRFREWISIPADAVAAWPSHLDAAFESAVTRAAAPRPKRTR